jgi:hypothetical protein
MEILEGISEVFFLEGLWEGLYRYGAFCHKILLYTRVYELHETALNVLLSMRPKTLKNEFVWVNLVK